MAMIKIFDYDDYEIPQYNFKYEKFPYNIDYKEKNNFICYHLNKKYYLCYIEPTSTDIYIKKTNLNLLNKKFGKDYFVNNLGNIEFTQKNYEYNFITKLLNEIAIHTNIYYVKN